jgi:NAD(P)-dependent dehydrogenase (short-subunit alcohol dehydrogenase family)
VSEAIDLEGQVVVVTGGGRGVGRGISERFLDAGAEVVVCSRSRPESLPASSDGQAEYVPCDVRDPESIERAIGAIAERHGRLSVLVNNAGGSPRAEAASASPRFSEAILRLNLLGPLWFSQQANALMQRQPEGGCIINIASVSGIRPSPGTAAYAAAKAGLLALTATLAVEWAPKVRVNAVVAGLIRTEQAHLHYGDEEGVRAVGDTIPLGRMGEPRDVGDVCLFLASPLARYVSGASVLAHGGGEKPAFLGAAKNATGGERSEP